MPFTILLVEEDPGAAEPLADFLRARGSRVWTAISGRDALRMLQRGWVRPSLMLVGLQGPRDELAQFLEACASEPLAAGVPLVVMSADRHLSVEALPAVTLVLPKPIAMDRLLEIVHAISKGSVPAAPALTYVVPAADTDEPTDPGA